MKKKVSIVVKLIGMSVLPVLLLGIILSIYGVHSLQEKLKSQINSGLESVTITIAGSYDAAGEGDFIQLESGNVIKGMTVVSGKYDQIGSVFVGNPAKVTKTGINWDRARPTQWLKANYLTN